ARFLHFAFVLQALAFALQRLALDGMPRRFQRLAFALQLLALLFRALAALFFDFAFALDALALLHLVLARAHLVGAVGLERLAFGLRRRLRRIGGHGNESQRTGKHHTREQLPDREHCELLSVGFDVPMRTSFTRLTTLGQPAMLPAEMPDLVLVVEPSSTARAQATQALQRGGYETLVAADLSQARSMARAPIVAVVIGERLATPGATRAFAVPVVVMSRDLAVSELAAAVRDATSPPGSPRPVSTPSLASGEAATRMVPPATAKQLKIIRALRDELAFLREATYF